MALPDFLSTREIAGVFAEEIQSLGGRVSDRFDDGGSRLFLRSILPPRQDVRRGDGLQGGVALLATDAEIRVHPYVFRQVCTNGAIRAHAVQTVRLGVPTLAEQVEYCFDELRRAVRACAEPDVFAEGVDEMRSTLHAELDLLLTIVPLLSRMPGGASNPVLAEIMSRAMADGRGSTRFAWMNAVTSVARDTRDPDLRWRLEALGGGVPAMRLVPPARPKPRAATAPAAERELVSA
jgi:hypothetical protein